MTETNTNKSIYKTLIYRYQIKQPNKQNEIKINHDATKEIEYFRQRLKEKKRKKKEPSRNLCPLAVATVNSFPLLDFFVYFGVRIVTSYLRGNSNESNED